MSCRWGGEETLGTLADRAQILEKNKKKRKGALRGETLKTTTRAHNTTKLHTPARAAGPTLNSRGRGATRREPARSVD